MDDQKRRRLNVIRLLVLVFVIALTLALIIFRHRLRHLGIYGYPGIFLISILSNATVLIPLPGVMFTSAMGAIFNPFWVAIAAGSGAALGELTGYMAGFSGTAVLEDKTWYTRIEGWMKKYGDIIILVLAFIPNPLLDLAGIASGALKLPVYRFLFWCWLGKIMKMMVFAYGGAWIFGWLPFK
jgi:uncharacterized membrane protein YdjX (TVP38/TMEM64 family)